MKPDSKVVNPFEGMTAKPKKTLPAIHEFSDGRKVKICAYQAKGFLDYVKSVATTRKGEEPNPLEISIAILHGVCFWLDGKTERRITREEIEGLNDADGMDLLEYVQAEITDEKALPDGEFIGTLPSGKIAQYRKSTLGTMSRAQRLHGAENAPYARVSLLCTIDGKEIDYIDVQIMDGLDFSAINDALGSRP